MAETKPGFLLKLRARPGCFDELAEFAADKRSGDDEVAHWCVAAATDEPGTLWILEVFRDDAALARHSSDPGLAEQHAQAAKLMTVPPERVTMRVLALS